MNHIVSVSSILLIIVILQIDADDCPVENGCTDNASCTDICKGKYRIISWINVNYCVSRTSSPAIHFLTGAGKCSCGLNVNGGNLACLNTKDLPAENDADCLRTCEIRVAYRTLADPPTLFCKNFDRILNEPTGECQPGGKCICK